MRIEEETLANGRRTYRFYHDNGEVTEHISVTTVLKVIASFGLERWRQRVVYEAARTALPDEDPDRVIARALASSGASQWGSHAHTLAEMADRFQHADGTTAADRNFMRTWSALLEEHQLTVLATERLVASHTRDLRIAGRLDRILHHPEYGIVVADLKTGGLHEHYALQLAAYAHCPTHWEGSPEDLRQVDRPQLNTQVGLILHMPANGRPKVQPVNLEGAWVAFQRAYDLYCWLTDQGERCLNMPALVPTVTALTQVLKAEEVPVDPLILYRQSLWRWLTQRIKNYPPDLKAKVAANWPEGTPTPKQVREGGRQPELQEMATIGYLLRNLESSERVPFEDEGALPAPQPPPNLPLEAIPLNPWSDQAHPEDIQRVKEKLAKLQKLLPKNRKMPYYASSARSLLLQTEREVDQKLAELIERSERNKETQ